VNAVRFARDISETGAPEEIRTPDPQIRSLVLRPLKVTFARAPVCRTRQKALRRGVHISVRQLEADTIVAADGAGALHRYAFAARCAAHRYWERPGLSLITIANAAKVSSKSLILFSGGPGRTGSYESLNIAVTM
jgi:hypothetical protein